MRCSALLAGLILASAATLAVPAIVNAEPLSADRPDFLTGPDVVGKGRYQIETGPQVERDEAAGLRTRTLTLPALLRIGISDRLELRLETDGRVKARETDLVTQTTTDTWGWGDGTIGVKWKTHEGDPTRGTPDIGWVVQATTATGSAAFRGHGLRPAVLGAFSWELPEDTGFAITAGISRDHSGTSWFTSGLLGAGFSKSINDRLTFAVEVVAQQLAGKRHGGNVVTTDLSATYAITDNLQVDALLGKGLTSEAPDLFFTVGISVRF